MSGQPLEEAIDVYGIAILVELDYEARLRGNGDVRMRIEQ
jgi:hypothetical protein